MAQEFYTHLSTVRFPGTIYYGVAKKIHRQNILKSFVHRLTIKAPRRVYIMYTASVAYSFPSTQRVSLSRRKSWVTGQPSYIPAMKEYSIDNQLDIFLLTCTNFVIC